MSQQGWSVFIEYLYLQFIFATIFADEVRKDRKLLLFIKHKYINLSSKYSYNKDITNYT